MSIKDFNSVGKKVGKKNTSYEKKPILQIKMMQNGKIYDINHMKDVETVNGRRILVDLVDQIMFLPIEFNSISPALMDDVKINSYGLKRKMDNSLELSKLNVDIPNSQPFM